MEIKSIQPTARFNADLANGEHIELDVKFVSIALDGADYASKNGKPYYSGMIRGMVVDAIVGWDLTENGVPIPCEGQKKADIANVLLGLELLNGGILGIALFSFVRDAGNFLKN